MRTRGRKGGRLQLDFSSPYLIQDICGKCVTLQNPDGKTVNTTYNVDHIKLYRRPESKDVVMAERQLDEPLTATRPSVIFKERRTGPKRRPHTRKGQQM